MALRGVVPAAVAVLVALGVALAGVPVDVAAAAARRAALASVATRRLVSPAAVAPAAVARRRGDWRRRPSLGVDHGLLQDPAVVVDGLDGDRLPLDGQVVEAVLRLPVPLPPPRGAGRRLRGDAAASACDEARKATQAAGMPKLLVVPVAGHQQVQAVRLVHLHVEASIDAAGEVRHHNLPVCAGLCQLLGKPLPLPRPAGRKPARAGAHGAGSAGAVRARVVVLAAADVVVGVRARALRVLVVGVQDVDVDREARIREVYVLAEVGGGHDPSSALPRVGNLLVPAVREAEAAPVVVPQRADPGRRSPVDAVEDQVELVRLSAAGSAHWRSAVHLEASPIEVVAHVQNEFWRIPPRARIEGCGHEDLSLVVDALDVAAGRGTLLAMRLIALDKRLVVTEQTVVPLVPAAPWKDVGLGRVAALVHDDARVAVPRLEGPVHAAPVPDGEGVVRPRARDDHPGPRHAVVGQGAAGGAGGHEVVVHAGGVEVHAELCQGRVVVPPIGFSPTLCEAQDLRAPRLQRAQRAALALLRPALVVRGRLRQGTVFRCPVEDGDKQD
mmetsp:Transcript_123746/g.361341  ORF Transcript_123746/g.361341 Transcript_123746/m.361341 type:complete len:557 (+) Transcript_123746:99-1769(+)